MNTGSRPPDLFPLNAGSGPANIAIFSKPADCDLLSENSANVDDLVQHIEYSTSQVTAINLAKISQIDTQCQT
jgi:hypothetical protein